MNNGEIILPGAFKGAMQLPLREDITVLPADNHNKLRLGWVVFEETGMAVVNNYAVDKIVMEYDAVDTIREYINQWMSQ